MFHSSDLYKSYFIKYWFYKIEVLKDFLDDPEKSKEKFESEILEYPRGHFKDFISTEILNLYYSIIETVLSLLYLFRTGKDTDIWCRLTLNGLQNKSKIDSIAKKLAEEDFDFLYKKQTLPNGKRIPLIEFSFLFNANFKNQNKKTSYLKCIEKLLEIAGKEYQDKTAYNITKHSLFFIPTQIDFKFEDIEELDFEKLTFENSVIYPEKPYKTDTKNLKIFIKKIYPEKYLELSELFASLVYNAIKIRSAAYFNEDIKGIFTLEDPEYVENLWLEGDYNKIGITTTREAFCK